MKTLILSLILTASVSISHALSGSFGGGAGMEGGSSYIIATVNIGDWDMDSTTTTTVSTGLTADIGDVRMIEVWVYDDSQNILYNLNTLQGDPQVVGGTVSDVTDPGDGTLDVTFDRMSSGFFDGADFNATGMNRGFITIIRIK